MTSEVNTESGPEIIDIELEDRVHTKNRIGTSLFMKDAEFKCKDCQVMPDLTLDGSEENYTTPHRVVYPGTKSNVDEESKDDIKLISDELAEVNAKRELFDDAKTPT